ncbi:MAG: XRE family transcriptional regulator [Bifidobacterium castoris]|nr:XRE family transcriptional regulator [Bifidobacterium castoris]
MHTTLDLSRYDAVTAYDDLPRSSVAHVDYLPTPQAVACRVREIIDSRRLDEEQVAEEAHVNVRVVRSLYEHGLASLRDARCVFAVLGIHVHEYPIEMVAMSL